MSTPVRLRRNVDMIATAPAPTDSPWGRTSHVFTSALPSHSIQRRIRPGSRDENSTSLGADGWSNAWRDNSRDDELNDPSQPSSSRSRSTSSERKDKEGRRKIPASRLFHPLSPPKPLRTHSQEQGTSSVRSTIGRERGNSDGSYDGFARDAAFADLAGSFRDKGKGKLMDEQREVFVHEITPTDSLAGVALKYGVELAELRKVNKLWASDTIHLRKVLYIPVDSQKFRPSAHEALVVVGEEDDLLTHQEGTAAARDPSGRSREASSSSRDTPSSGVLGAATVRRVPASQLAFFPPPTTPARRSAPNTSLKGDSFPSDLTGLQSSPKSLTPPLNQPDGTGLPSFAAFTSSALSSSIRGIPSILAALPNIAPSRVSFSSEGTSERSDDVDVELDDTSKWRRFDTVGISHSLFSGPAATGTSRKRSGKGKLSDIDWSTYAAGSIGTIRSGATSHAPASWALAPANQTIRTQQPSPSPSMELPRRSKPP